ncbi:MAG: hypothetical protein GY913_30210 [Proteobacteria bacterium]|nr:hypothetical protein [Pseudomonadota bacterium]MCP4921192.1 hypothetical protein [Pseudomonadota bacterium]
MLLLSLACADDIGTAPADVRVTFDAIAWTCDDAGDDGTFDYWVGVEQLFLDVQHAPGELFPYELPDEGCEVWTSPFPDGNHVTGSDLPDRDGPLTWSMPLIATFGQPGEGELEQELGGFWRADLFNDYNTCHEAADVLGAEVSFGGSELLAATTLPEPGTLEQVLVDVDIEDGVTIGETIELGWTAEGWDQAFVGFERRRDGVPVEAIVCDAAGLDAYTLDAAFWSLSEVDLPGTTARVMVGFANREFEEGDLRMEKVSRAVWQVSAH